MNTFSSLAVLGEPAQILAPLPSHTCGSGWGLIVGEGTTVREHVTIHASTFTGAAAALPLGVWGSTEVGSGCLLQAGSHIGN